MTTVTVDQFFAEEKPPNNLEVVERRLQDFVNANGSKGRPVVCVTCGGTTVPLEANTVRFIDNFSTGYLCSI
jgi:phosphopantothenate-cysteine ligase